MSGELFGNCFAKMMKTYKTLLIRVSFFFFLPLWLQENNFLGEHSFLFINVKSENKGQEGSFYKQAIYDSFQWNSEPMGSNVVIRICQYIKELYDCQLQIISEASPHKHVK